MGAIQASHGRPRTRSRATMLRGLFLRYATVLVVATAVLIVSPISVSVPITPSQFAVLVAGLTLVLVVSWLLLRQALAPLAGLARLMRRVDPLAPGQRIEIDAANEEVAALADAFNDMLDRLEGERRDSARRALAAQEDERRRIARELHDEIGQTLAGLLIRSEALVRRAPPELRSDLEQLRDAARRGAMDAREIARRLRPEALDELGLVSALAVLADQLPLEVDLSVDPSVDLDSEEELVVYRVAQESLTNVVRHSDVGHASLMLRNELDGVTLVIRDEGVGISPLSDERGGGIRGMRERALLIGARLSVAPLACSGTEVRLHLPHKRS
jgi:two-component system, NarL family, sensor histidine kinase UhpB